MLLRGQKFLGFPIHDVNVALDSETDQIAIDLTLEGAFAHVEGQVNKDTKEAFYGLTPVSAASLGTTQTQLRLKGTYSDFVEKTSTVTAAGLDPMSSTMLQAADRFIRDRGLIPADLISSVAVTHEPDTQSYDVRVVSSGSIPQNVFQALGEREGAVSEVTVRGASYDLDKDTSLTSLRVPLAVISNTLDAPGPVSTSAPPSRFSYEAYEYAVCRLAGAGTVTSSTVKFDSARACFEVAIGTNGLTTLYEPGYRFPYSQAWVRSCEYLRSEDVTKTTVMVPLGVLDSQTSDNTVSSSGYKRYGTTATNTLPNQWTQPLTGTGNSASLSKEGEDMTEHEHDHEDEVEEKETPRNRVVQTTIENFALAGKVVASSKLNATLLSVMRKHLTKAGVDTGFLDSDVGQAFALWGLPTGVMASMDTDMAKNAVPEAARSTLLKAADAAQLGASIKGMELGADMVLPMFMEMADVAKTHASAFVEEAAEAVGDETGTDGAVKNAAQAAALAAAKTL